MFGLQFSLSFGERQFMLNPLAGQQAFYVLGKDLIGLETNQQLIIDQKGRPVEDSQAPADAIQLSDRCVASAAIITGFELRLINAGIDGRIDEISPIGRPQQGLVGKKLIVDAPEGVRTLPAYAIGRSMGIETGVTMIEYGPKDDAHLTIFYIIGDYFLLRA